MPGYPNKIIRTSLGPTYENANKVANPKQEIDAAVFNLMAWQVAGMNGCVPRGVIIGQADNASISLLKQWFAWDPNGALGPTALTRTGVGAYTWQLPGSGSYPDMNGGLVAAQIEFAFVNCHAGTARYMTADVDNNGRQGTMYCWLNNAAAEIGFAGAPRKFCLVLI